MSEDSHDAPTAHASSCSQCEALRAQLSDARSTLARIRNVATAAHAPLAQCLDWCANEAVFALDRLAPPSHDDAPVRSARGTAEPTVPVARYIAAMDAAEMLWTVVANASGGDWQMQSPEWQIAAARWRDNYHAELHRYRALQQTWPVVDAVFSPPAHAPSGASDAPVAPCPYCAAMRAALETARPTLKHAAVDGSPDALAALDLVAQALDQPAR